MQTQTYNCKKCGLTLASTCSKCDKVVDIKVLDDGCLVQITKCSAVSYTDLTLPPTPYV